MVDPVDISPEDELFQRMRSGNITHIASQIFSIHKYYRNSVHQQTISSIISSMEKEIALAEE